MSMFGPPGPPPSPLALVLFCLFILSLPVLAGVAIDRYLLWH